MKRVKLLLLALCLISLTACGEDSDERLARQLDNSESNCFWATRVADMGTMYWHFEYVPSMEVISWLHVGGTFREYFKVNDIAQGMLDKSVEVVATITGRWGVLDGNLRLQYDLNTFEIVDYTWGWIIYKDINRKDLLDIANAFFYELYAGQNEEDADWGNLSMSADEQSFTFEAADMGRLRAVLNCNAEDDFTCESGDEYNADDIIKKFGL